MRNNERLSVVVCLGLGAIALLSLCGKGLHCLLPTSPEYTEMICRWDDGHYTHAPCSAAHPSNPSPVSHADLDGDGINEAVTVASGRAILRRGDEVLWQSDPSWLVTHAVFADSNHDGRVELNVALWKHGTYGPDRPFFVKERDNEWSCHLFLYAWRAKALRCIWGSSAISSPICEIAFADLRGDDNPDLVVLESSSSSDEHAPPTHLAVWRWNGWGFTNEFRSNRAPYSDLRVISADHGDLALVSQR